MKNYLTYYVDDNGKRRCTLQKAVDDVDCCTLLAARGIVPVALWGVAMPSLLAAPRLSGRLLAMLFSQLSMALSGGVPLLDALYYMEREQRNERMRALLARLQQGVLAGHAFSQVLKRESGVAPMIAEWLAIGEKQGRLAQVMDDIAAHLENQEKMKKQVQQQLLYPMIVLVAVLLVGAFLSIVVMPMMARQFMGYDTEVSGVMRVFLLMHDFLASYGVGLLLLAAVIAGGLYWSAHRQHGNQVVMVIGRRVVLSVPLLRKFFVLRVYVPFARFLGQMLRSGVPADEAVCSLQAYFATSLFARDVNVIATILGQGGSLSAAMADTAFVPEMARQMLVNGERYGRISEALLNSADYYESTLMEELHLWIRFVEPLAVALLGGLVLFMALGLFLPVLESYQTILAQ